MTTFLVFKDNERVGIGYAIWYDGRMGEPTLIGDDGTELNPDWYQILPTEQRLVVLTETIQ